MWRKNEICVFSASQRLRGKTWFFAPSLPHVNHAESVEIRVLQDMSVAFE